MDNTEVFRVMAEALGLGQGERSTTSPPPQNEIGHGQHGHPVHQDLKIVSAVAVDVAAHRGAAVGHGVAQPDRAPLNAAVPTNANAWLPPVVVLASMMKRSILSPSAETKCDMAGARSAAIYQSHQTRTYGAGAAGQRVEAETADQAVEAAPAESTSAPSRPNNWLFRAVAGEGIGRSGAGKRALDRREDERGGEVRQRDRAGGEVDGDAAANDVLGS